MLAPFTGVSPGPFPSSPRQGPPPLGTRGSISITLSARSSRRGQHDLDTHGLARAGNLGTRVRGHSHIEASGIQGTRKEDVTSEAPPAPSISLRLTASAVAQATVPS